MKKILLFAISAVFAVSASAQSVTTSQKVQKDFATASMKQFSGQLEVSPAKAPRKNASNGVLYNRPVGTLFHAWSKEGSGYAASFLFVPPFTDLVFENVSTAEGDPIWTIGTNDITEYADENGTMNFGSLNIQNPYDEAGGVSYYYMPTLTIGDNSFTLASEGKGASYSTTSGLVVDSLNTLSFYDQHYSGYGFGSMEGTHYLYGTGTVNGIEPLYIEVDFEQPAAPLYLEDAYLPFYTTQEQPIPAGQHITLQFVELDEYGELTDNILGEMTATGEDIYDVEDVTESIQANLGYEGNWWSGSIIFSNKSEDDFGTTVLEPVIIDKPFAVLVLGVNDEGVSIGFQSTTIADGMNLQPTYFPVEEDGTVHYYRYTGEGLHISFTGMFDVITLQDTDTGIYTAPTEGGIATRVDNEEYNTIYVYTAYPWRDHLDNENYFIDVEWADGDEPWFELVYDDSYYGNQSESGSYYAVTMLQATADALPAGVESRSATIHIYGPAAEQSIVVTQGDVNAIDALPTQVANRSDISYNTLGQRVTKNFRGIVVKDGKKVIR